jgi:hypothetical protein
MKVKDLIASLQEMDLEAEVMVRDSIGPRTINGGVRSYTVSESDAEECGDCEGLVGKKVVLVGFGSY